MTEASVLDGDNATGEADVLKIAGGAGAGGTGTDGANEADGAGAIGTGGGDVGKGGTLVTGGSDDDDTESFVLSICSLSNVT